MTDQLKCSICGNLYTPTEEEGKLHESGDLAMLICGVCCTVKEDPEGSFMKLFFFDNSQYIAAKSKEDAVEFFKDDFSIEENEMKEIEVEEIPEMDWKNKTIVFEEYDEQGEAITLPFDEYLNQFSISDLPLLIATKDY